MHAASDQCSVFIPAVGIMLLQVLRSPWPRPTHLNMYNMHRTSRDAYICAALGCTKHIKECKADTMLYLFKIGYRLTRQTIDAYNVHALCGRHPRSLTSARHCTPQTRTLCLMSPFFKKKKKYVIEKTVVWSQYSAYKIINTLFIKLYLMSIIAMWNFLGFCMK